MDKDRTLSTWISWHHTRERTRSYIEPRERSLLGRVADRSEEHYPNLEYDNRQIVRHRRCWSRPSPGSIRQRSDPILQILVQREQQLQYNYYWQYGILRWVDVKLDFSVGLNCSLVSFRSLSQGRPCIRVWLAWNRHVRDWGRQDDAAQDARSLGIICRRQVPQVNGQVFIIYQQYGNDFFFRSVPKIGLEWPSLKENSNEMVYPNIIKPDEIVEEASSNIGERNFWGSLGLGNNFNVVSL